MEKHERERRKEEERLLRERQREEERFQREQRRELERREKNLQKESIRVCKEFSQFSVIWLIKIRMLMFIGSCRLRKGNRRKNYAERKRQQGSKQPMRELLLAGWPKNQRN